MTDKIEKLLENFPCDLCGKYNTHFLYTKNGTLTNYPFRIVRCKNCGLIYINPRLGEQAITDLYNHDYYGGNGFDPIVNYIEDSKKQNQTDTEHIDMQDIINVINIVNPPSKLLDFGCGLGGFMQKALSHGYNVEGFELSPFCVDFVKKKGFNVYDNIDKLPKGKYDIVTSFEVLEHCSSPMKALLAIYECLKPGGIFYYTTANFDNFYNKWLLGIKDPLDGYIVPEGHIHFFSTSVMKSYFSTIGFSKVVKFEHKNYQKAGSTYKLLSRLGFTNPEGTPKTILEKLSYYGTRKVATVLGMRKRNLPLAIK